jgi:hypothetical protein
MGRNAGAKARAKLRKLEGELSDRELKYCVARAAGVPKGRAAYEAGYASEKGMLSAGVAASKLESRNRVQEYIRLLRAGHLSRIAMRMPEAKALVQRLESEEEFEKIAENLVEELIRADRDWAYADPGEIFEMKNGRIVIRDFSKLTKTQRMRIEQIKAHNLPDGSVMFVAKLYSAAAARARLYAWNGLETRGRRPANAVASDCPPAELELGAGPSPAANGGISSNDVHAIRAKAMGFPDEAPDQAYMPVSEAPDAEANEDES